MLKNAKKLSLITLCILIWLTSVLGGVISADENFKYFINLTPGMLDYSNYSTNDIFNSDGSYTFFNDDNKTRQQYQAAFKIVGDNQANLKTAVNQAIIDSPTTAAIVLGVEILKSQNSAGAASSIEIKPILYGKTAAGDGVSLTAQGYVNSGETRTFTLPLTDAHKNVDWNNYTIQMQNYAASVKNVQVKVAGIMVNGVTSQISTIKTTAEPTTTSPYDGKDIIYKFSTITYGGWGCTAGNYNKTTWAQNDAGLTRDYKFGGVTYSCKGPNSVGGFNQVQDKYRAPLANPEITKFFVDVTNNTSVKARVKIMGAGVAAAGADSTLPIAYPNKTTKIAFECPEGVKASEFQVFMINYEDGGWADGENLFTWSPLYSGPEEPEPTTEPSKHPFGDLNIDNKINAKDVLILRKYLVDNGTNINLEKADCENDSTINSKDVLALRKYLAGIQDYLGPRPPAQTTTSLPTWKYTIVVQQHIK